MFAITATTNRLIEPSQELLAAACDAEPSHEEHDRLAGLLPALQAIERLQGTKQPKNGAELLRIASWNAERCKFRAPSAALLSALNADVILLSEMDIGMARSGNRHTIGELASDLSAGYVFGVEYVELGLGDNREKLWHAGQTNTVGLHGNGILCCSKLHDPFVIRLDEAGRWFAGTQDTSERRIGWRMAIGGFYPFGRSKLCVLSVHLESSTDSRDRAHQMSLLFEGLKVFARGCPVIIGGDLNTSELPPADGAHLEWFEAPFAYEPLFELAQEAGFEWQTSNIAFPTERTRPDGTPMPPFRKIDWFLTRGLRASDARTVPAVDSSGVAISDHEVIVVSCVPSDV